MSPRILAGFGLALVALLAAAVVVVLRDDGHGAPETSPAPLRLVVGGRPLSIPANAVRFADQRVPGPQPRLDLALTWPELEGRTTANAARFDTPDYAPDVIHLTIRPRGDDGDGATRLATVYARFFVGEPWTTPSGLQGRRMAPKSGYGDEEIYLEPGAVRPFVARCFPLASGEPPRMCLSDTRHGSLAVELRFPRTLVDHWREIDAGLDTRLAAWGVETR